MKEYKYFYFDNSEEFLPQTFNIYAINCTKEEFYNASKNISRTNAGTLLKLKNRVKILVNDGTETFFAEKCFYILTDTKNYKGRLYFAVIGYNSLSIRNDMLSLSLRFLYSLVLKQTDPNGYDFFHMNRKGHISYCSEKEYNENISKNTIFKPLSSKRDSISLYYIKDAYLITDQIIKLNDLKTNLFSGFLDNINGNIYFKIRHSDFVAYEFPFNLHKNIFADFLMNIYNGIINENYLLNIEKSGIRSQLVELGSIMATYKKKKEEVFQIQKSILEQNEKELNHINKTYNDILKNLTDEEKLLLEMRKI